MQGDQVNNESVNVMKQKFGKPMLSRDEFINGLDRITKDLNNQEKLLLLEVADQNMNNNININEFIYIVFESHEIQGIF